MQRSKILISLVLAFAVVVTQAGMVFAAPAKQGDGNPHPVGTALAVFFSEEIEGLDYETIMAVYAEGTGFGVIAQALWLTMKLGGDSDDFIAMINAKNSGDYGGFFAEGENVPRNWGQFKKALLNGEKKANLGAIMSEKAQDKANNGNTNNGNNGKAVENGKANDNDNNGKGKGKDQ
jgi:hypothetical protein